MFVSHNALVRGVLSNQAGDGDGGAGGSGTAGAGATDPPKTLTAADVAQIANSAVTAQLKRSLGPAVAEGLKGLNFEEILTPIVTKIAPKQETPPPGGEPKPDPRLSAIEAKYAELENKYKASEAARQEAEQKSRDAAAFTALKSALTPHVRPDMLDVAARDLFLAQKRVSFDESGRPLLTVKKAPFQGGPEEDVPMSIEDGAAHWAKTEGKMFAPAPSGGAPNGGTRAPRANIGRDGLPVYDKPATTDAEKIQRAEERARALSSKYPNLA